MGAKKSPISFSPVTSTNVGISSQKFTLNFTTFATLISNFKIIPSASLKSLKLNQEHPLKKLFLWSNSYKIVVMITSLIEMLELQNFGHMNTPAMQFESSNTTLLVTSWA